MYFTWIFQFNLRTDAAEKDCSCARVGHPHARTNDANARERNIWRFIRDRPVLLHLLLKHFDATCYGKCEGRRTPSPPPAEPIRERRGRSIRIVIIKEDDSRPSCNVVFSPDGHSATRRQKVPACATPYDCNHSSQRWH